MKKLHINLGKNAGIYIANRILSRIITIFNKAGKVGDNNPAKGIKSFKMQSRDRFIQPEEFPKFFAALDAEPNKTAKDFIYISLLTGARKNNVLKMKWGDLSLSNAQWRIPETKNGDALTIPLVTDALTILELRHTQNNKSENPSDYVFPGVGRAGHLADPKKAWQRILKNAEIDNLRLHDLRRSLGSYQAILGANSFTIGKSLGHKSQAATAVYARMNLDPVRNSMQAATSEMFRLKKG